MFNPQRIGYIRERGFIKGEFIMIKDRKPFEEWMNKYKDVKAIKDEGTMVKVIQDGLDALIRAENPTEH